MTVMGQSEDVRDDSRRRRGPRALARVCFATLAALVAVALHAPGALAQDVADPEAAARAELEEMCGVVVYPDDPARFIQRYDVSGDGLEDVVIRYDVTCGGVEQVFCGRSSSALEAKMRCAGGVYVALESGGYRHTSLPPEFEAATLPDGAAAVRVEMHGASCGLTPGETCQTFYQWNGEDFELVELDETIVVASAEPAGDGAATAAQPPLEEPGPVVEAPAAPQTAPEATPASGDGVANPVPGRQTPPSPAPSSDGGGGGGGATNPVPGRSAETPPAPSGDGGGSGGGGLSNPVPGRAAETPPAPPSDGGGGANPVPGRSAETPPAPSGDGGGGGGVANPVPGRAAETPPAPPSDGGGGANPVPGRSAETPAEPSGDGGGSGGGGGGLANPVPGRAAETPPAPPSDGGGGAANPVPGRSTETPAEPSGGDLTNPVPGRPTGAPDSPAPADGGAGGGLNNPVPDRSSDTPPTPEEQRSAAADADDERSLAGKPTQIAAAAEETAAEPRLEAPSPPDAAQTTPEEQDVAVAAPDAAPAAPAGEAAAPEAAAEEQDVAVAAPDAAPAAPADAPAAPEAAAEEQDVAVAAPEAAPEAPGDSAQDLAPTEPADAAETPDAAPDEQDVAVAAPDPAPETPAAAPPVDLTPVDPTVPTEASAERWWYERLAERAALSAILGEDGRSTLILSCDSRDPTVLITLAASPDAAQSAGLPDSDGALLPVEFAIAGSQGEVRLMAYDAKLRAWTDRISPTGALMDGLMAGNDVTASPAAQSAALFTATLRGSSKALRALLKTCEA